MFSKHEKPHPIQVDPQRESEIHENISEVLNDIENNKVERARLVMVSKPNPASDCAAAFSSGQLHFGENYVQELVEKSLEVNHFYPFMFLPHEIRWHFIGRLQSNKCKALASIPNLWAIETIDSEEKAKKMNDAWAAANHDEPLNIYVQVNTSNEPNKGGVEPDDLIRVCTSIDKTCPNLNFLGLMTIGSVENSALSPNPDFVKLAELRDEISSVLGYQLELSMGMSSDYQDALKLGSNNVRVGSKIFGSRAPKA
ncbi:UPF0001 protein [Smittium mucronatum]|uniref:Pyridoxal phosphate homeostasis protein n=1 Tax=Smittium mucronatum TaxID=133383 RepID=A0A1R0H2Q7_9FUNG|nr:UPF0001 protein [Smittium mucronatum]